MLGFPKLMFYIEIRKYPHKNIFPGMTTLYNENY